MNSNFFLSWQVGFSDSVNNEPLKWIPAAVPGAVQLDIAKAENYPDYIFSDNYKQFLWCEKKFWHYRTFFDKNISEKQKLFFVSKGIDYEFKIFFNGKEIFYQEGMFTPVRVELSNLKDKNNELNVVIFPVPTVEGQPDDKAQASQSVKPAVSWGWDWHPRIIPLGIWDATYLEIKSEFYIKDTDFNYELNETLDYADFTFTANLNTENPLIYCLKILNNLSGNIAFEQTGNCSKSISTTDKIKNVELWNPVGYGIQNMYKVELTIFNNDNILLDIIAFEIGFRKVKLLLNEGTEQEPPGFPKTRRKAPITLEVNGRKIFAKGTNWVNPEIFWGKITDEKYDKLITLASEANFNIIRVWGGAIINKDRFFKLCDEKGILVWQDFPLACNNYESSHKYLKVLKQEALSIIKKVKNHPCLALWNGGNELFNSWSGMDDQSKAIRLLNALCLEITPDVPFIPTAPSEGMGHGHYMFIDAETGEEVFELMNRSRFTAYSEFGNPSISKIDILKKIIPEDELNFPSPTESWKIHHAFFAWCIKDSWSSLDVISHYFGETEKIEELIYKSDILQSVGYKYIFEEARRQKPYCSMALNWCFNEPWPTAANNSIINYPDLPKPAYYAVKESCRPQMLSARFKKFQWIANENFECELFFLNDLYSGINQLNVNVKIIGSTEENIFEWKTPEITENRNVSGPKIKFKIPNWDCDFFRVKLECKTNPEFDSEYQFSLKK